MTKGGDPRCYLSPEEFDRIIGRMREAYETKRLTPTSEDVARTYAVTPVVADLLVFNYFARGLDETVRRNPEYLLDD